MHMGWTIVAADKAGGRIEASQRSRWMGFTDDIVVRTPVSSGSRIDLRSSSRYGRSDFGVNADRIRAYLTALHAARSHPGLAQSSSLNRYLGNDPVFDRYLPQQ
jgi:hypothetical protein